MPINISFEHPVNVIYVFINYNLLSTTFIVLKIISTINRGLANISNEMALSGKFKASYYLVVN